MDKRPDNDFLFIWTVSKAIQIGISGQLSLMTEISFKRRLDAVVFTWQVGATPVPTNVIPMTLCYIIAPIIEDEASHDLSNINQNPCIIPVDISYYKLYTGLLVELHPN